MILTSMIKIKNRGFLSTCPLRSREKKQLETVSNEIKKEKLRAPRVIFPLDSFRCPTPTCTVVSNRATIDDYKML